MLYHSFQTIADMSYPMRLLAGATTGAFRNAWPGALSNECVRKTFAACELMNLAGVTHERPSFGIERVNTELGSVPVIEEVALRAPFGSLVRFRKQPQPTQPRVLLIAPLSGHFATLLRATVRTLLTDHDVYVTDWTNPRDVPLSAGRFGMDEYVAQLIQWMAFVGKGAHVVAVCQPTVGALAAVSLMAEDDHPATPRTMTLMAGPIDTRVNPTKVNHLATSHSLAWFEKHMVTQVPNRYPGAERRVYPGFLQLSAFVNMNRERHISALGDLYRHRVAGDHARAEAIRVFYEEYFAVMDLPAEFYLETIRAVFQEHDLPRGAMRIGARTVNPGAIGKTALLTVEGERDDICAIGQTLAAQDLCTGLRPYMKQHHVQPGVGHYGVFSGRRWETGIYPRLREFIYSGGKG